MSTPSFPLHDDVYRQVENLVSHHYLSPTILGQKPWTRSEVAHLVGQSGRSSPAKKKNDYADLLFKKLTLRLHQELVDLRYIEGDSTPVRGRLIDEWEVRGSYLKSPPAFIRQNVTIGSITARVNPLRSYESGRQPTDGWQWATETTHQLSFPKHVSFFARPRFEINAPRTPEDSSSEVELQLQTGYGVFEAKNFSVEVGRNEFLLGSAEHGGFILSENARPLDLVKVTNPHPARLPWVFSHLGKWKYTLFGANLGPDDFFRYSWLAGWKLSVMPFSFLEVGFAHSVMMGGEGAPDLSLADVTGEYIGFRPAGRGGENKANHMMEADVLARIPRLRGLNLYAIVNNEDKRDTFTRFVRDGNAYLSGIYLPRLDTFGRADLRIEVIRISPIHYRHSIFPRGHTLNGLLLGHDLGPDSFGARFHMRYHIRDPIRLGLRLEWDLRRSHDRASQIEADGTPGDVVTVQEGPTERRYRTVAEVLWYKKDAHTLRTLVGYEHATNFRFQSGAEGNNILVGMILTFHFGDRFQFSLGKRHTS